MRARWDFFLCWAHKIKALKRSLRGNATPLSASFRALSRLKDFQSLSSSHQTYSLNRNGRIRQILVEIVSLSTYIKQSQKFEAYIEIFSQARVCIYIYIDIDIHTS